MAIGRMDFNYATSLWGDRFAMRLDLQALGILDEADDQGKFIVLGKSRGFRGVPENGAWVKNASSVSVSQLIPIWKAKAGTLVTGPFVDFARLEMDNVGLGTVDSVGYGVGTYFYLKNINIPGFGLEIGQNKPYDDFFVNFSLGASI